MRFQLDHIQFNGFTLYYIKKQIARKNKKNNPKKEIDSNERLFGLTKRKAEIARKNDFFIHSNNFTDRYRYVKYTCNYINE